MKSLSLSVVKREPPVLFRVLHDYELDGIWRPNLPEVFPLNGERTPFGADWQKLSYALNPGMTGDKWRSLYAYNRAFTNGTGFNGTEPKADYVNDIDLDCPDPAWDKTRVCGGATITGVIDGPDLIVKILDGDGPAPSLDWLLAHPWFYFHALNTTDAGLTRFPLVGSGEARIPLKQLQKVPGIADPYCYGYIPSPY
jgi:hypothetical protein